MAYPEALDGLGIAAFMGFEEVLGLFPELFKIWPRRKRVWHITFLLSPVVRRAGSIKVMIASTIGR
jgi:hypothetical protein